MRRSSDPAPLLTALGDWMDARPRTMLVVGSVVAIVALGYVDYLTGPQVAFSIFYLLPIATISWKSSRRMSVLVCLLGAVTWISADIASGAQHAHWWIPVWNTVTRFGVFMLVASLIGTLHRTLREQAILANIDPLTGVENARSFRRHAEAQLNEMRTNRFPMTFAYIDVDDFKHVNDSLGHSGGDELLRTIGSALIAVTRDTDRVGRVGGDEFALLLPETGSEGARHVMESLQQRVGESLEIRPGFRVSLSTGAVTFLVAPESADEMVTIADNLMYEAKRAGKATYRHVTIGEDSPDAMPDRSAPRKRDGPPRVIDLTEEPTGSLVSR